MKTSTRWAPRALTLLLLALLLLDLGGCAVFQRPSREVRDLRREAIAGDAESQYRLGMHYITGDGVRRDDEEGLVWFRHAAVRNQLAALHEIGMAYYKGRGVAQDYDEAVEWFKRAAVQGYAPSQFQLAEAYLNGRGVAKERSWAARWFGEAAVQGYAPAQFNLGVAYAAGLGVPLDREEAMMWLIRAEMGGYAQAKEVRGKVAGQSGPVVEERAFRRARDFQPMLGEPNALDKPTARFIQYALNEIGFDAGPVDGDLGPASRHAIATYWKSRGMPAVEEPSVALVLRLRTELRDRQSSL